MKGVQFIEAGELRRLIHGGECGDQSNGQSIIDSGWQRPPLELLLRRGGAPALADGNRRVRWLAANGGGDVEIPVKLVIR